MFCESKPEGGVDEEDEDDAILRDDDDLDLLFFNDEDEESLSNKRDRCFNNDGKVFLLLFVNRRILFGIMLLFLVLIL